MSKRPLPWIGIAAGAVGAVGVGYLTYRLVRGLRHTSPVTATVSIAKPPHEVYAAFRDFSRLPDFMTYLSSVEENGSLSTWTAKPLGHGPALQWRATIDEDVPGVRISWKSVDDSTVKVDGEIEFTEAPGRDDVTEVRVKLEIGAAPFGVSRVLARLFAAPEVKGDMRRFKQLLETGEVLRSDASAHAAPYPAQPSASPNAAPATFVETPPTAEKGLGHPLSTSIGGKGVG
ncbi:MAG: SRPBCC family protein [Kofleriaceae bacterium]